MTEINTTARAGQQAPQQQQVPQQPAPARRGPRPTNASANRISGLGSGINSDQVIGKIMDVERRRLEPVQDQRNDTQRELQAFDIVNQSLNKITATVTTLKNRSTWEGKLIESSDESIVTATANAAARPGKHTLVVDQLALNHQIASQGYSTQDTQVGTGRFIVTVGENSPVTVVVDESSNTLVGLKDAINTATDEVNATIIRTGNTKTPYQLVLTSQTTGSEGRIKLEVQLKGAETPNFQNAVEAPSPWKGVGEPAGPTKPPLIGVGASTAIVQVVGQYTGDDDQRFTFTAVQNGVVGGEKQLQLRWEDEDGRTGLLNLDKLNYAPGQPLEFVDGLALVFSEGEIIVNDSFSFDAKTTRSELEWWLEPEERLAVVSQPTSWQRQRTEAFGAPLVEGNYTGDEEQTFTLRVEGSGQVGRAKDLRIVWSSDESDKTGVVGVGDGYEPGTPLAIIDGVTVTVKPGVLSDGQEATFEVIPEDSTSQWWKSDSERKVPSRIENVSNWALPDLDEDEPAGFMPGLPDDIGPRISTSPISISGQYTGEEAKVFTFTALAGGSVGTSKGLRVRWDDAKGNSGELTVDEKYRPGTPLEFAEGLSVAFGAGRLFEEDSFTVRTRTSTIQPAQDAKIRFGATELGGGLPVTNSKNELDGVIDGVRLNLVTASEKPVTITIRGDTEAAAENVRTFVQNYNELAAVIAELTKFDKDTETGGPLLGNRDLTMIQNTLSGLLMDPVAGLPKSANILASLGITFDDKGFLALDESKLSKRIEDDFGLVADLFRDKGESDNSNVAFVGMTDETRINTDGYEVDIQRPATQAQYITPPLPPRIVLDGNNSRFFISVDGKRSELITLEPGGYNVGSYARALQDAITNDDVVGERRVRVITEDNRIKVISGRFGASSEISFVPAEEGGQPGVGLVGGEMLPGRDVEGTINGSVAEGSGQLLKAPEKSGPAAGLRVFVKLPESQVNREGPEAAVKITRGVASRVSTYLDSIVNPRTGDMRRITQNLRQRVSDLDQQLGRMEGRIESKRQRLQDKFARLESQMSSLKAQQAYMQSQMAGMGGGGALPGLPG